ncbi:DUF1810 domain-containing protein [Sphingomonas sp. JC676]|uniref:DUF1810 domain-containing protein n=1 Tax=Sphingomonas sp. JC676 TaxID=2768065 RepID=UPI0016583717|nr:DUF1810 domain-containing protein [Sphingomonas sp. JC676]MBC9034696.1 DUF1810 domain-containing protein [Sphingomonas sp. JC676]
MVELERFEEAQREIYPRALAELKAGRKASHWMWFVFPQIAGLGRSAMATHYAITGLDEARAYLAHPVLGARLREAAKAMCGHAGLSVEAILGGIDAVKFRSSMTLFEAAAQGEPKALFGTCIDAFYGGARDPATLERIKRD